MGKRQPEQWQALLGTNTLDPLQVQDLQDAVRAKKKRFQMQGVWFDLHYSDDGKTVRYSPELDFVPMGYIEISRLLSEV